MNEYLYSVYDRVAQKYNYPFCAENNGIALRTLCRALNARRDDLVFFTNDYELWLIGEYDSYRGKFKNRELQELVANSKDVESLVKNVHLNIGDENVKDNNDKKED